MSRIIIDIDETICTRPKGLDHLGIEKYNHCLPNDYMVDMINEMYEAGHEIIFWTSRGMSSLGGNCTKIEGKLRPITEKQLSDWGVKYHELWMCKPHYDLLIDDKTVHPKAVNPSIFYRIREFFGIKF